MTNEEKAIQIAANNRVNYYKGEFGWGLNNVSSETECYVSALQAMEWKEQQLIDRACEWLKNNIYDCKYYTTNEPEQRFLLEDFKQAMKGE